MTEKDGYTIYEKGEARAKNEAEEIFDWMTAAYAVLDRFRWKAGQKPGAVTRVLSDEKRAALAHLKDTTWRQP